MPVAAVNASMMPWVISTRAVCVSVLQKEMASFSTSIVSVTIEVTVSPGTVTVTVTVSVVVSPVPHAVNTMANATNNKPSRFMRIPFHVVVRPKAVV